MTYSIIPESAPFSSEQRAWLNGFLAGMLGVLDAEKARGGDPSALVAATALGNPLPSELQNNAPEETYPWHDPSLSIADRMELAKDRPIENRLMAAMAQLNCGSCGYVCNTYAEAIAEGREKNLTLCTPGGGETAKMIRLVVKEKSNPTNQNKEQVKEPASLDSKLGTRENPVTTNLISSIRLNSDTSSKDTRHVRINLRETGLKYRVGDALGIFPTNCVGLISHVITAAHMTSDHAESIERKCLRTITPDLVELAIELVKSRPKKNGSVGKDAELVSELESFLDSDQLMEWDVLEFLEHFSDIRWEPNSFVNSLVDLRPRLYSIASSQSKFQNEVHLTVGRVENEVRGRNRKGVASTMLADRMLEGDQVRVFVHSSHDFTIPSDPNVPMIMVGPGTGIAPFIGFLQQREADQAKGKNWLFFGDQKQASDFLYREALEKWISSGLLTRLDTAFSRDGSSKVYVQHRILEQGESLYSWLLAGAAFYVCGDASRMAKDVDAALHQVVELHGNKTPQAAKDFIQELISTKRYVRDVY